MMNVSVTKIWFVVFFVSTFSFANLEKTNYMYRFCSNATTLTGNSAYTANIDHFFSYISTNATDHDGFFNTTMGQGPNLLYGLFLCRGDLHPDDCCDCINLAAADAAQSCANNTWAIIWYDQCMLRYSNQSIFSSMAEDPGVMWYEHDDQVELDGFSRLVATVMKDVASRASNSTKKFATKEVTLTEFRSLYSLAQCTPDISVEDCNKCLQDAVRDLVVELNGNISGFVMYPSCTAQYRTTPFYNIINNQAKPHRPPVSTSESDHPLLLPPPHPGQNGISSKRLIEIFVPTVGFLILSTFLCCFPGWKVSKKLIAQRNRRDGIKARAMQSLQFEYRLIEDATNKFAEVNKIGAGGFGSVYKGILPDGEEIAVKRLSTSSGQGADEFQTEVVLVAKLQHRNLVKLLGYCIERKERMLIYEFVTNKSLDYFLFDPEKQRQLDWPQRFKIIQGIARGLLYLHSDSRLKIIHRDLKAANILLDQDMTPKISDFGMARLVGENTSLQHTNRIVGTYGYMCPQYAMQGRFSDKSDVFSFGVLILEIVCGKRNPNFCHSAYADSLLTYVWNHWKNGAAMELMDSTLRDSCVSNEVVRCIQIGLLCVQENPEARPTMARVVLMLSSSSVTLPLPQRTAFFLGSISDENLSSMDHKSDKSTSTASSSAATVNETSLTELFPR